MSTANILEKGLHKKDGIDSNMCKGLCTRQSLIQSLMGTGTEQAAFMNMVVHSQAALCHSGIVSQKIVQAF